MCCQLLTSKVEIYDICNKHLNDIDTIYHWGITKTNKIWKFCQTEGRKKCSFLKCFFHKTEIFLILGSATRWWCVCVPFSLSPSSKRFAFFPSLSHTHTSYLSLSLSLLKKVCAVFSLKRSLLSETKQKEK